MTVVIWRFLALLSAQLSSGQRAEAARRGFKMHTRTHTQTHSLFSCDKRSMCNHVQSAHRCTETPSLKKSICGYIDHCWGLLMGHMGKQRGKSCLKLGLLLLVYFCMVGTWQYTDGRYDKIDDITREGKRKGKNKYHLKKKKTLSPLEYSVKSIPCHILPFRRFICQLTPLLLGEMTRYSKKSIKIGFLGWSLIICA